MELLEKKADFVSQGYGCGFQLCNSTYVNTELSSSGKEFYKAIKSYNRPERISRFIGLANISNMWTTETTVNSN